MIWQNNKLDHRDTPHTFPKESKPIPHANIWLSHMLLFFIWNLINYSEKVQNIYHDSSIHKKKNLWNDEITNVLFFFYCKDMAEQ
jgi:hypothetical protein